VYRCLSGYLFANPASHRQPPVSSQPGQASPLVARIMLQSGQCLRRQPAAAPSSSFLRHSQSPYRLYVYQYHARWSVRRPASQPGCGGSRCQHAASRQGLQNRGKTGHARRGRCQSSHQHSNNSDYAGTPHPAWHGWKFHRPLNRHQLSGSGLIQTDQRHDHHQDEAVHRCAGG